MMATLDSTQGTSNAQRVLPILHETEHMQQHVQNQQESINNCFKFGDSQAGVPV